MFKSTFIEFVGEYILHTQILITKIVESIDYSWRSRVYDCDGLLCTNVRVYTCTR